MNKYIDEVKTDILDDIMKNKTKDINKDNAVTRMARENRKISEGGYTVNLTEEFTDIPLEWISFRPENEYSIQSIEKLANSIYEIGLIQPLVVYAGSIEAGKKYTISDGCRRLHALHRCFERAQKENNKEKIEQFTYVKCRVLDSEMRKNEEAIHHDSNLSRINTIFEIVARYKPSEPETYFGNSDTNPKRKEYIENKYGKGAWTQYKNNEISVKWNINALNEDIFMRFNQDYPQYQIKIDSVSKYIRTVIKLSPESIKAVNNEDFHLDKVKFDMLAKLSFEVQNEIVRRLWNGEEFDKIIFEYMPVSEIAKEQTIEEELDDKKFIIKTGKTFINLSNRSLERISNLSTKELNGNQKEYLKQIKKINKEIEKLSQMPTK